MSIYATVWTTTIPPRDTTNGTADHDGPPDEPETRLELATCGWNNLTRISINQTSAYITPTEAADLAAALTRYTPRGTP